MKDKLRRNYSIPALALLVATVGVGYGAMPAAAAPASATGTDYRPSVWAEESAGASAEQAPRLTESAGQAQGGTGSQLPIGLGLVGLGVLGLVYGLAKQIGKRRGVRTRSVANVAKWPRAGHPSAETGVRS